MTGGHEVPPAADGRGLGGGPAQLFKPRSTVRAKKLHNTATPAERLFWQQLRSDRLGRKFSRQMPVGPYLADVLCPPLIVEPDGISHNYIVEYDNRRDVCCRSPGFAILRFSNADVMNNLEGVVSHIRAILTLAHPRPLPQAGGSE